MTLRKRRVLVVLIGLAIILVGFFPIVLIGAAQVSILNKIAPPLEILKGYDETHWAVTHRIAVILVSFISLMLALGISFVFFFWDRRLTKTSRYVIYFSLFIVMAGASMASFAMDDIMYGNSVQAGIDLVLIFIGSVLVLMLVDIKPRSKEGKVLQAMALLMITGFAVVLPAQYAIIWALNQLGAITLTQSKQIGIMWLGGIAGAISSLVAILNYRRTRLPEPDSPIIKPQ
jgi:hypothetical protein